jgi:predicted ATPase
MPAVAPAGSAAFAGAGAAGPLVPLGGRSEAYLVLEECWQRVLAGARQLTLIEGEMGVGKTRLVKSFLDAATTASPATVLKGCCYELSPPASHQPLREALRGALTGDFLAGPGLSSWPRPVLEDVARLVPELRQHLLGLPGLPPPSPRLGGLLGGEGRHRLAGSVARFLAGLCGNDQDDGRMSRPLVLFLDDLHLADHDTLELLALLVRWLDGLPVWVLAVYRSPEAEPAAENPLLELATDPDTVWLGIGRLDSVALDEVARSLVAEEQAAELARFLDLHGGGLPLVLTELVNFLADEGALVAAKTAGTPGTNPGWRLARPLEDLQVPEEDLGALTLRRVRRLPNSTRRLAALAAVVGHQFDAGLLQLAAEEHPGVVEIGLEILLQRWFIRRFVPHWTRRRGEGGEGGERDGVEGTSELGVFEFCHEHIRDAIYHDLNPLRRQAMHAQVASALEELRGEELRADPENLENPENSEREAACEALAFHHRTAGQWERAVPYLLQAAERSVALAAKESALRYCDQAIEALSRLVAAARNDEQAERWSGERLSVRQLRETIERS